MKTPIEELFSNDQYCYSELNRISDIIHSNNFLRSIDTLHKELGIMYCYCSKDVSDHIIMLIEEIRVRELLLRNKKLIISAWNNKECIILF